MQPCSPTLDWAAVYTHVCYKLDHHFKPPALMNYAATCQQTQRHTAEHVAVALPKMPAAVLASAMHSCGCPVQQHKSKQAVHSQAGTYCISDRSVCSNQ
jgi:hypothetical protein